MGIMWAEYVKFTSGSILDWTLTGDVNYITVYFENTSYILKLTTTELREMGLKSFAHNFFFLLSLSLDRLAMLKGSESLANHTAVEVRFNETIRLSRMVLVLLLADSDGINAITLDK